MRRLALLHSLALLFVLAVALPGHAQDATRWRPSTTEMPAMPTMAELQNDGTSRFGPWLNGLDGLIGVSAPSLRATANPRAGTSRAEVVRLVRGPVPVVVFTDRNGDERADMIEYYRDGRLSVQMIDADYSGRANSLRFYDTSGALLREERM